MHSCLYLQVFQNKQLHSILEGLSVHLVEASPAMAALQASTIQATDITAHSSTSSSSPSPTAHVSAGCYQSGRVAGEVEVSWYRQLKDVPHGVFLFLVFVIV